MTPSPENLAMEEQASHWAARLDGSALTAADQAELAAWLEKNPAHRALLSQYCQFSADLEQYLPALVAAGRVSPPARRRRRWSTSWWLPCTLAAAAAIALIIVAYRPRLESFATAAGQRQSVTLSDGTRVDLNAHTSLVMDNRGSERHVQLAEGEGFFSVAKDKSRPFIIETPAGSVRVTGTVFDVRSETVRDLEVMVIEGSVQVRPVHAPATESSAPYALVRGDKLVANDAGVSVVSLPMAELEQTLAWRNGQIVFNGTPLVDALARFARYHGRAITVAPEASALRVSGRYSLDDLDGFFANLEQVLPVRVTRDLSGAVRVTRRGE